MGKDKLIQKLSNTSGANPLKTKEMYEKDNMKYNSRLYAVQKRYEEVREVILQLDRDYEKSKELAPPARYKELKEMVKRTVTDLNIEKSKPPSQGEIKLEAKHSLASGLVSKAQEFSSSGNRNGPSASSASSASSGGLLGACRQFAGMSSASNQQYADEKMSKKEVVENIEQTKHEISAFDTKFLRVHNRLVKLKQDYEASKGHAFTTRYTLLKDMIKTVIRDKKLLS